MTAALRTDELATVAGEQGSTERPATVTLARRHRRKGRGSVALKLAVGAGAGRRLRRRRAVNARVTVVARDRDGGVLVATRRLRIVAGRRRAAG